MMEIHRAAGRLIVFRFGQRVTLSELGPFVAEVRKHLGDVAKEGRRAVTCGDVRQTSILTPDVVDGLIALLRNDNAVIEKTGVVVGNATFGLQVERMFREAGNPMRQAYRDVDALTKFLAPSLQPDELAAVRAHLTPATTT
jgi:hypothetical protein